MTRISDMTELTTLPATGAFVPVEKAGSTTNFRYNLGNVPTSDSLFTNAANLSVPVGFSVVATTGYSTLDVGGAIYVYDAAVNAAYVIAHPRSSFVTVNSRGFRLSLEQDINPEMLGAPDITDDYAAFQATVDLLPAAGGNVTVLAGTYKLLTTPTWGAKDVRWNISSAATFTGAGATTFLSTARTLDVGLRTDLAASSGASLTGFIQSGTGAVTRTVQDKLRENLTVLDFGAKGDGIRKTSGSTTSGSATFTDVNGAFSAADIGKSILIFGGSGVQTNLLTTIAAVASPTSITLSAAPTVTMTGNVVYCYGHDDTAAFVAHAAAYQTLGLPAVIPDTGNAYLVMADQITYAPPTRDNALYIAAPAIKADATAKIMALSGGAYLIQFGTPASDYSGYLRGGTYNMPDIDGNNLSFTKAPLYLPFFIDIELCGSVRNAKRCAWFGSTSAPAASAGVKGDINFARDIELSARTVQSITNAVNPTVTFASAHGLWASSGNQVVCINLTGTLGSWAALHNKSVDCTVLSATQIQLKNVDSTSWGALPGTSTAYLNSDSVRVAKAISGVTNANPCVITTAVPHLLTSGDTADVAEIGGMDPSVDAGRTGIQGQYVATVLTSTTFSIPVDTTSTTNYGSYSATLGAGQVMPWVALASCDIGVYLDNCADADLFDCYFQHIRLPIYANPSTVGFDGKYTNIHFYSSPEAGEILTPLYAGGDNDMDGCQVDGPFRYSAWFFGPRNTLRGHKLNHGGVGPTNNYACMVRTETGAGVMASGCGLKSASGSFKLLKDHSGYGTYSTDGSNFYSNVTLVVGEYGSGRRAASVRFAGADGTYSTSFQVSAVTRSSAGIYVIDFNRAIPLDALLSGGSGTANGVVSEDESYGSRTVYKRQIKTHLAGTLTDLAHVSLTWRYA